MKLLFVSNTSINSPKGGWDGLGSKVLNSLRNLNITCDVLENLSPKTTWLSLNYSRFQKLFKIPRIYPAFSKSRLQKISDLYFKFVTTQNYTHILFHGSTPWIMIQPNIEYSTLLDCSFPTYVKTYLNKESFNASCIDFINKKERIFLSKARSVYFTSQWALNETKREHKMNGENFIYLSQGPSFDLTNREIKNSVIKNQFVFVATDFIGKGGLVIFEAFKRFVEKRREYLLVIVGQKPLDFVINHPNIKYLGYINKSSQEGRDQFVKLYAESKSNLLLSNRDILPLVIIESGLCGCPTVATAFNAIPELIEDEVTGWLIQQSITDLYETMLKISEMDQFTILKIRYAVQQKMLKEFNWDIIMKRLVENIN